MPDRRPNIIWIMTDDLAWGDLGCFGQELIATPHLDRFAAEGMKFTHCYAGSTVCAPSRSCLMQGLHGGHASVRDNMRAFAKGKQFRASLQPGAVTVAGVLKDAGYATGLFGKWGLACYDQTGRPNEAGFDEFFGYLNQRQAHSYYPEFLWHNTERVPFPGNVGHNCRKPNAYDAAGRIVPNGVADPAAARYAFDEYAARGMDFVRAHHDEPFFLYLAYTTPHGVLAAPELGEYRDKPWPLLHKVYAAMVTRTDRAVGELLRLLAELKLDEQTLTFFVSDNGYSQQGYPRPGPTLDEIFHHSGPYKGVKGHLNQGGLRVPGLARWPGHIRAGVVSGQPWAFWDFLPTAAEAAGVKAPACDGLSILPTLLGKEQRAQHEYFYWEYRDEQAARIGPWWAYRREPRASPPVGSSSAGETPAAPQSKEPSKSVQLFDADGDPRESRNLAAANPDVVHCVEDIFHAAHVPTPQTPSPGESVDHWVARATKAGVKLVHNLERF